MNGPARHALPPTPIRYDAARLAKRLLASESLFHEYDAGSYRVLEAAAHSMACPAAVWQSVQRFPQIWDRLSTTTGEHEIAKVRSNADPISPGNVLRADAVVWGIPLAMENKIISVVENSMFHMSVRALGGRFESEVEARVRAFSGGTLLLWRQGYPRDRLLSKLTIRLLLRREAAETKRILELWVREVGG